MMPILFRIILFLPLGLLAQKGGVSNTTLSVQNNAVSVNGSDSLIQDSASTVVFGMAGVAQSLGAVDNVIELNQFAEYLRKLFRQEKVQM